MRGASSPGAASPPRLTWDCIWSRSWRAKTSGSASRRRWTIPMATNDARVSADARVAAYWAAFLGCTPEQLETPETWVGPHANAGLGDYRGVYLLRRGESCVVSIPAPLLAMVTAQLAGLPAASTFD